MGVVPCGPFFPWSESKRDACGRAAVWPLHRQPSAHLLLTSASIKGISHVARQPNEDLHIFHRFHDHLSTTCSILARPHTRIRDLPTGVRFKPCLTGNTETSARVHYIPFVRKQLPCNCPYPAKPSMGFSRLAERKGPRIVIDISSPRLPIVIFQLDGRRIGGSLSRR